MLGSLRRKSLTVAALAVATVFASAVGANADPAPGPVGGGDLAGAGTVVHLASGLPAPPDIPAAGWLVADLDTGAVLAAKDPHGRYAPASTLKVLTALVMVPRLVPAQVITATRNQVHIEGSKVGVVPDHAYTVDMLLQGMLLVSGNDAARVLAGSLGGETAVAQLMNNTAADLHADDTHTDNVTGLDAPGQSSSAYDLALISRAALALPMFARYVRTDRAEFSGAGVKPFQISNHNPLLTRYPGTYGVKNGYTDAARASYVGAARRGGHNLMITMIKADPAFRGAAVALLDWGFAADGKVTPVGRLVPAGAAGGIRIPPAQVMTAAAGTTPTAQHRNGPSSLSWALTGVGGGLIVLAGWRLTRRRRSRLGRSGLTLPPR